MYSITSSNCCAFRARITCNCGSSRQHRQPKHVKIAWPTLPVGSNYPFQAMVVHQCLVVLPAATCTVPGARMHAGGTQEVITLAVLAPPHSTTHSVLMDICWGSAAASGKRSLWQRGRCWTAARMQHACTSGVTRSAHLCPVLVRLINPPDEINRPVPLCSAHAVVLVGHVEVEVRLAALDAALVM